MEACLARVVDLYTRAIDEVCAAWTMGKLAVLHFKCYTDFLFLYINRKRRPGDGGARILPSRPRGPVCKLVFAAVDCSAAAMYKKKLNEQKQCSIMSNCSIFLKQSACDCSCHDGIWDRSCSSLSIGQYKRRGTCAHRAASAQSGPQSGHACKWYNHHLHEPEPPQW